MKLIGVFIASGLTLLVIGAVGIFSFLPPNKPAQPVETAPVIEPTPVVEQVGPDLPQIEATLAQREAVYQQQIAGLNQALQERQTTYHSQIQQLEAQIAAAQNQLNQLKAQEQNLLAQVAQLETGRAERLATYQAQLQQAKEQYLARYTQLQSQLTEIQTRLAQANAQLGR